jgi:hypothetical protein
MKEAKMKPLAKYDMLISPVFSATSHMAELVRVKAKQAPKEYQIHFLP